MAVTPEQLEKDVVFEVPSGRRYQMVISRNVAKDITPPGWKDKRPSADKGKGKKKEKVQETSGGEKVQPTKIFTFGEIAEREGLKDVSELMEQANKVSSES